MSPKVLIAEDDKFLTKIYQAKLKGEGYEVILAGDGEEALAKMSSEKPHLVLLDIIMPKKTGFDVLEERNKDENLKKTPVIVLSNLGQEDDKEKAITLGAVDYIIKANVSLAEVIEKIEKHLEGIEIIQEENKQTEEVCSNCNSKNAQGAKFCSNCGQNLTQ